MIVEGCMFTSPNRRWLRRTFYQRIKTRWHTIGFDSYCQLLRLGMFEGEHIAEHVEEVEVPEGLTGFDMDCNELTFVGWDFLR